MKLGLRLLLAFFLITGIAAFFVLRVFVQEVRPSVREVMEEVLVDTANILAEMAAEDLAAMPAGGTLQDSAFGDRLRRYAAREVDAKIWGLSKQTMDYRVLVTDERGRVVFDSGDGQGGSELGQDHSRWRDVLLTLRGEYGARATRERPDDDTSSVMHVAAPVRHDGRIIGVLSVAKPLRTVMPFVERAERKILVSGVWLLGLSLAVGVLVTAWLVASVRRLRRYAQEVQFGERRAPPQLSGELGELASAMGAMRDRLDGREHLEHTVRALTHELKSPMAAIGAAAELLQDELPAADRQAFAAEVRDQVRRQQELVERLLELSKLEHRRSLPTVQPTDLGHCVDAVAARLEMAARRRGVRLRCTRRAPASVQGDPQTLELAIGNLLDNAIGFSPEGGEVEVEVDADADRAWLTVRDHGPGVEDFALGRLGERFFSTPRPGEAGQPSRKGSGLGLAIVREVMSLHGGQMRFENAGPGLRATLTLPRA